jgi:hypothetical protein
VRYDIYMTLGGKGLILCFLSMARNSHHGSKVDASQNEYIRSPVNSGLSSVRSDLVTG